MPDERVLVGVFGAPHGVRGELRLKSYTQDPGAIAHYRLTDEAGGRVFALTASRCIKADLLVVRVEGVASREAAAALTHQRLFMRKADLPARGPEEFYHADLIGLEAVTADGQTLGRVTALLDFGAGDIVEITPPEGQPLLFPFTRAVVPSIDLAAGQLMIVPPAETEAKPDAEA